MSTRDVPPQVGDLPALGRPANSALAEAGILSLTKVATCSRRELLALHGVGATAIRILEAALDERGLTFAESAGRD